jgi:hypothetical protein
MFGGGVHRVRWLAAAALAVGLTGVAPAPARADACAADARASYARVQLFRDSACTGASVSVGFTGSGDRPDFAAFTNYEGNVYDIDDTRDSVAVAPATCVQLFDGRNYTGASSGKLCAAASMDGLFADLGAMVNRASSMRVCPASVPAGCAPAAAPPAPVPAPISNGSPASPTARLSATLAHGRARRAVRFGRGAAVRVGLIDETGRPITAAELQVLTREVRSGSEWRLAPGVTTGADGRALVRLAAGPSRRVRIEYRVHTGDARAVVADEVRLDVRAGVTLKIRPRHLHGGRTIGLRGRLLAAPATRLGKVITLQARERGRWRDFKSTRTRRTGRFATRYRFTSGARGTFPIRAVAQADASYPYATGRSHAVRVHVA